MWDYPVASRLLTLRMLHSTVCPFCRHALARYTPGQVYASSGKRLLFQYSQCPCCGWWRVYRVHQHENPRTAGIEGYSGTVGALQELDLTDISLPLSEVRQYLVAKSESMYAISPKLMEDVVGSIFASAGWKVRVTAFMKDDGIDVILDGPDGKTTGVQVKRYAKNLKIEAEQIRSLVGAMMLGDHTRGVFITTSSFRSGAHDAARRYGAKGIPVELYDGDQFLQALGHAQVSAESNLSATRLNARVLLHCFHVGSGLEAPLRDNEDLLKRLVIASAFTQDEFIEFTEEE